MTELPPTARIFVSLDGKTASAAPFFEQQDDNQQDLIMLVIDHKAVEV